MINYLFFYLKKFFPHVKTGHIHHLFRSGLAGLLRPDRPPLPCFVQVEPTTRCNFNCSHCARVHFQIGEAHFSLDNYKKVLLELPAAVIVLLQGQGEPFLCPHFFEMISIARGKKIYTATCTNGSLVLRYADELIESGLNYLAYSIDAIGNSVAQFRRGIQWNSIEKGLTMLDGHRGRNITRAVWTTMSKESLPHVRDIFEWGVKRGFTSFHFQLLQCFHNEDLRDQIPGAQEGMAVYNQLKKSVRRGSGMIISHSPFSNGQKRANCSFPWAGSYIDVYGNVRPCCVAFGDQYIMGNISTQPFDKIWNNNSFIGFRKQMKSPHPPECCTICHFL